MFPFTGSKVVILLAGPFTLTSWILKLYIVNRSHMKLALMLTSGDIICNVVFTGSYYLDDKANALSGIL